MQCSREEYLELLIGMCSGLIDQSVEENVLLSHIRSEGDYKKALETLLCEFDRSDVLSYSGVIYHLMFLLRRDDLLINTPVYALLGMIGNKTDSEPNLRKQLIAKIVDKFLVKFDDKVDLFYAIPISKDYADYLESDLELIAEDMVLDMCIDTLGELFFMVLYPAANVSMEDYYLILNCFIKDEYKNAYEILCKYLQNSKNSNLIELLLRIINVQYVYHQYVNNVKEVTLLTHNAEGVFGTDTCSEDAYSYMFD